LLRLKHERLDLADRQAASHGPELNRLDNRNRHRAEWHPHTLKAGPLLSRGVMLTAPATTSAVPTAALTNFVRRRMGDDDRVMSCSLI
jgi:hypothetical protein